MDNARNARIAKMAKTTRMNRNKAALVKRNLIRRFGREQGEVRFGNSRWAQYDEDEYADMPGMIQLSREDKYADLLQGNPYVRAEAERRVALGWNFENSVRNALISVQCDPQRVADIYNEVGVRLARNDEIFEAEVSKVMVEL
jgi:hypothetical protein